MLIGLTAPGDESMRQLFPSCMRVLRSSNGVSMTVRADAAAIDAKTMAGRNPETMGSIRNVPSQAANVDE